MSVAYKAVEWNAHKRVYDLTVTLAVTIYLLGFVAVGKLIFRGEHRISDEVLFIRALGTCAFLMLHVVLCIGPLARLDRRFAPLLYNRRHLGVATFVVGAMHGLLVLGYYHGFGVIAPPLSLLTSNTQYGSLLAFPFEALGVVALLILFLMAATSHDFWLKNLTPTVWKSLHMLVYLAWAMLVLHVALGALLAERSAVYPAVLLSGAVLVVLLHLVTGWRERRRDRVVGDGEWVDVAGIDDIPPDRALTACVDHERVAVFRYGNKLSALTNVCAHQGGPIGEGKIVGGCVTCPWHGYQYLAHNGCSPPPFTEKIRTYRVRVEGGRVLLDPKALPPGTPVNPAVIGADQ
jgi:sulfoxide reductase heme-binding subunit YedZ